MAEFNPSKKYPNDFNNGKKYKSGDGIQPEMINSIIEGILYAQQSDGSGGVIPYELEVASTSTLWEQVNGRWQVRVLQTQHNFKNVQDIIAERLSEGGTYENMIYGYKKYSSGSIAIIVDEKIDIKIIIKGV